MPTRRDFLTQGAAAFVSALFPISVPPRLKQADTADGQASDWLYAGKPMSYWVARLDQPVEDPELECVNRTWILVNFGQAAVPHLIDGLNNEFPGDATLQLQFLASPRTVQMLTLALKHKHARVRSGAIEALYAIALYRCMRPGVVAPLKRTLPAVAEALNDEDLAVRGWAQRFLCDFGAALDPRFSNPLDGLDDEHPSLRAAAVRLLAKLPSQQAIPFLESKLRDPDRSVRFEVAKVLSQYNPGHPGIVPAFVEHLLQGESIGPDGFSCLDRIMEKAAPLLQQALRSGNTKTRIAIVCSLGWSKTQAAFSTVAEMLDDPAPEVRAQAASSLWHFVDTQDILPHLLKAARDTDQQVRHQARWAVRMAVRMSGLAKKALSDLIRVLESDGPDACELVAWALSELGEEAEAAVPALERNLDHDSAAVRLSAAVALAHIRPDNARLPSILWEGLSHPCWEIRDKSFQGLKNLGRGVKTILPQLIDGLEDPSKRATSAALLSGVGPGASKAMNRLLSLLKLHIPGDSELKHYVPSALASIGPKAVGPLLKLLEHRDLFVRVRLPEPSLTDRLG
jgi:HEAT repeat protein